MKAVIDLTFGDSGKGLFTDFLCSKTKNPLVVRFNGGQQAAHRVVIGKLEHIFSNFGSGTLRNIPTYWSKYCTFDPMGIMKELKILKEKGIEPILYIDELCPITTPLEKKLNKAREEINQHGSCGTGYGTTIEREEKFYHLTALDLLYPVIFAEKLKLLEQYYDDNINSDFYIACLNLLKSKNIKIIDKIPNEYNLIFEGSQGLLLDQHYGFFPHVTRSNTGTKNILDMGFNPEIYLITRAYQTRHGTGPMEMIKYKHKIIREPNEKNINNPWQGEFRIGLLNLSLLEYAIKKDEYIKKKNKNLVITCLDHIINDYRFSYKNEIYECKNEDDFIFHISKILKIDSIFISKTPYSKNIQKWG